MCTTPGTCRDANCFAANAVLSGTGAMSAPASAPASPRTVPVNPPVDEDLFVTPQRQAAAAVSLVLRLALWPLFLLRELLMLPRRCAGCNLLHPGTSSAACRDGVGETRGPATPSRTRSTYLRGMITVSSFCSS